MEMICPVAFYLFTMSQPRPGGGGGGSEGAAEDEDDAVHIRKKGNRIRYIGATCCEAALKAP